jgi:uncharacterized protein YndB with AHSA1/START domain
MPGEAVSPPSRRDVRRASTPLAPRMICSQAGEARHGCGNSVAQRARKLWPITLRSRAERNFGKLCGFERFMVPGTVAMDRGTMMTHTASRTILASPRNVFRALIDPKAMPVWRAPQGMHMRVERYEPKAGELFRLELSYDDPANRVGKSGDNRDVVEGRIAELDPEERIVEEVTFQSDDPSFAGTMRVVTTLAPVQGGTKVTISAENVPPGVSEADHLEGMNSTLKNLADFLE